MCKMFNLQGCNSINNLLLGGSSQLVSGQGPWLVGPLSMVVPLTNGLNGLYMGVTNHLLTGMILQVGTQSPGAAEKPYSSRIWSNCDVNNAKR